MSNSNENNENNFVNENETYKQYSNNALKAIVKATQLSKKLPLGQDHEYCHSFGEFTTKTENLKERLLQQVEKLLSFNNTTEVHIDRELEPEDQFDIVVENIDQLLERVDIIVDSEIRGIQNSIIKTKDGVLDSKTLNNKKKNESQVINFKNIARPQLKFSEKVDNSNNPFVPKLKQKPNAITPKNDFIRMDEDGLSFIHPYQEELEKLKISTDQLTEVVPEPYKEIDDNFEGCQWVDTVAELEKLATYLSSNTIFAIDLEAHAYRSFSGFVCLMQISTREKDFLVDTLELRSSMHLLLDCFSNPNIIKVLHGADMDIQWLQRDFGLYIVNMFDTGQAARVLAFPRFSLSYLLKTYCDVDADKKYQLADWRIRPIPSEMKYYARADTHYLLYIYDLLKNELIARSNEDGNLLLSVWERSRDVAQRTFEKTLWNEKAFQNLFLKYNRNFSKTQLSVFKALFDWRDRISRREDESPRYVLPNHMIFQIAENIPSEKAKLLSVCNPEPPLVRLHVHDLLALIRVAKTKPDDPNLNLFEDEETIKRQALERENQAKQKGNSKFALLGLDSDTKSCDMSKRLARCEPVFEKPSSKTMHLFENSGGKQLVTNDILIDILANFQDPYFSYSDELVDLVRSNIVNNPSENENENKNNNNDNNNNQNNNNKSKCNNSNDDLTSSPTFEVITFENKEMRKTLETKNVQGVGEDITMLSELNNSRISGKRKAKKGKSKKRAKFDDTEEIKPFDYKTQDKFRGAPPTIDLDMSGKKKTFGSDTKPMELKQSWEPRINVASKSGEKIIDSNSKKSKKKQHWPSKKK